jgi:hypothetical protein
MIIWCCVCRQHFPENESLALRDNGPLDRHDCPPKNEPGGICGIELNPNPNNRAGEMYVCKICAKVIAEARK